MTPSNSALEVQGIWKIKDLRSLLPFVLVVLAGTFPSLYVLRRNPEFLKAQGLSLSDGLVLFFGLFLFLPLALSLSAFALDRLGRTRWAWRSLVFLCCFIFQLPALSALPPLASLPGAFICAYFLTGELERRPVLSRWTVRILLPAWLLSGLVFWLSGDVAQAFPVVPKSVEMRQLQFQETDVSVIFLLFDELPVTTLMTPEGEIDERHFPHFADLSRHSTWYRAALSPSAKTIEVVPKLVSGTREPLPTQESLLTLFQKSHRVERFDDVVSLAPPTSTFQAGKLLRTWRDFGVIYLHVIVPKAWKSFLPVADQGWTDFGTTERRYEQAFQSLQQITGGDRPLFFFAHYLLPHGPYRYREQGTVAASSFLSESASMLEETTFRQFFLQLKAVDQLLGVALQKLRDEGLWERCVLVVVADHGISFNPGDLPRSTEGEAIYETLHVPLFIRTPGQKNGVKSDLPLSLLDVMPLVVQALGGKDPWAFDGQLPQDRQPDKNTLEALRKISAKKYQRFDLQGKASVYGPPWLSKNWGQPPPETQGTVSDLSWENLTQTLFQEVDLQQAVLPLTVEVELQGAVPSGSALVVTVNGRVAAGTNRFTADFDESEKRFLSLPIPAELLQDGPNQVHLFLLDHVNGEKRWRKVVAPGQEEVRYLPEGVLLLGKQRHSVQKAEPKDLSYRFLKMASGSWRIQIISQSFTWSEVLVVPTQGGLPHLRRDTQTSFAGAPLILATVQRAAELEDLLVLVKTEQGYLQAARVEEP